MEKRSWSWKKKTSDKGLTSTDLQADEKIRRLNERLLAADDLAKQHATVAEEAVSGWEKTKAEYMSAKYQLDIALEQKQAAEVRVFHLDGTLKECMQQLRQAREEQEQGIHDAIIKKSREWDKVRLDLEERLADAEAQLIDSGNQKTLLHKTVKEKAEAVAELGSIRSEAEAAITKLQVQVQTLEKENTSLKYEIVVLNKELGIRNQEREMNNRSIDMASQQCMESTKRIAKLETECQKLRALVRKKLPGPGALLQMKLEAGMDAERVDILNKRRSGCRAAASPKAGQAGMFQRSPRMDLMGPGLHITEKEHTSDDGNDDDRSVADSWTSGITTESAYFQKERPPVQQPNNANSVEAIEKLNSIDDFLEIERLVALKPIIKVEQSPSRISEQVLTKDAELQAANKLCTEVSKKLAVGEEQLNLSRSKNMATEWNLFSLQQKLLTILDTPERGDPEMVLGKLKKVVIASKSSSVNGLPTQSMNLCRDGACDHRTSSLCSFRAAHLQEDSLVEHCAPELTTFICKIIRVVEDLVSKSIADFRECQLSDNVNGHNDIQSKPKLQLSELEASVKKFNAVGNAYLYGKAELVQFMAELYSVLNQLNTLSRTYKTVSFRMKWRQDAVQIAEQEILSDVGSPFSLSSNSDRSDSLAHKDSSVDERLGSQKVQVEKAASESRLREEFSGTTTMERAIAELKREKAELENKLEEERGKLDLMKGQLLDSEQLVVTLRARLASAELSGIVAEKSLASITAVKAQLELRLEDSQLELRRLREKLKDLEIRNEQEKRRNDELQMKIEESRALERNMSSSLHDNVEKSSKDQEIADATEKLAECQRTILDLGKQLKDIVSIQDGNLFVTYLNETQDNAATTELLKHGNPIPTLQKAKQRSPSDPEACSISQVSIDELAVSPKSTGSGLQNQVIDVQDEKNPLQKDDACAKPHEDANKQLVLYVPKPASRKKPNLHSLPASAMSKSLNLEPSASPRKHANSFSKFFSRHKSPS